VSELKELERDDLITMLASEAQSEPQRRALSTLIERCSDLDKYQIWAALLKVGLTVPEAKEQEKCRRVSLTEAAEELRQPRWDGLVYNERSAELQFLFPPPCETAHCEFPASLVDADFTSIVAAFDAMGLAVSYDNAIKDAQRAASFRSFDPVRDYLESLDWDGQERLAWWLKDYFGATVDPDEDDEAQAKEASWNQEIGLRWMISAVARALSPGCQVDSILIAEGPQGVGKSSAFRDLVPDENWFACDLPDIRHKDSVQHILGPWIIELDELHALSRREATSIKSYISRRVDRARLSYAKTSTNHPRRVVFSRRRVTFKGKRAWRYVKSVLADAGQR
jgi:predicted P-loop ATPase